MHLKIGGHFALVVMGEPASMARGEIRTADSNEPTVEPKRLEGLGISISAQSNSRPMHCFEKKTKKKRGECCAEGYLMTFNL